MARDRCETGSGGTTLSSPALMRLIIEPMGQFAKSDRVSHTRSLFLVEIETHLKGSAYCSSNRHWPTDARLSPQYLDRPNCNPNSNPDERPSILGKRLKAICTASISSIDCARRSAGGYRFCFMRLEYMALRAWKQVGKPDDETMSGVCALVKLLILTMAAVYIFGPDEFSPGGFSCHQSVCWWGIGSCAGMPASLSIADLPCIANRVADSLTICRRLRSKTERDLARTMRASSAATGEEIARAGFRWRFIKMRISPYIGIAR